MEVSQIFRAVPAAVLYDTVQRLQVLLEASESYAAGLLVGAYDYKLALLWDCIYHVVMSDLPEVFEGCCYAPRLAFDGWGHYEFE